MSNTIDAYLQELDGAVGLLRQAQDLDGDDHQHLIDLAADAWMAARDFGGFGRRAVDLNVSEFEIERLAAAQIEPQTYVRMLQVYLTKRLTSVRVALRILNER